MKVSIFICILLSIGTVLKGQALQFDSRSDADPLLAPFYHGVASGDPLPNAVIIWTRLTPGEPGEYQINWRIATDTLFTNVVNTGVVSTDVEKDYTVKTDVTGLQANTWYYYDFEIDGIHSIIGRTKTAPVGPVLQTRLAVVSCADYQNGYYNAYRNIVQRNNVDAVIHLGDYIYEYAASSSLGREHEPPGETIQLEDYRTRYSHYRLDPDLRLLHQQFPMICVWDDHESANNAWMGGAQNHTEGAEGNWEDRKAYSIRAHEEWLPIRKPDSDNTNRIYRKFSYGNLAEIFMLDTRIIGRDEQGAGSSSTRKLLGEEQMEWLKEGLTSSTKTWKIIGQQVMMAPLLAFSNPVNNDQWDGYPSDRADLLQHILQNDIRNVAVLTGDIHSAWANDIPFGSYNNSNVNAITGSAAVEFVTTSITSASLPLGIPLALIQSQNNHIRYADLTRKGYYVLDITPAKIQADYIFVSTITNTSFTTTFGAHWFANEGERFLRQGSQPSLALFPQQALAPTLPQIPIIVKTTFTFDVLGVYPNPANDKVVIQYNAFNGGNLNLVVTNMEGKELLNKQIEQAKIGLNYTEINLSNFTTGAYIVNCIQGTQVKKWKIIKL